MKTVLILFTGLIRGAIKLLSKKQPNPLLNYIDDNNQKFNKICIHVSLYFRQLFFVEFPPKNCICFIVPQSQVLAKPRQGNTDDFQNRVNKEEEAFIEQPLDLTTGTLSNLLSRYVL